jgi:hypothetical protein
MRAFATVTARVSRCTEALAVAAHAVVRAEIGARTLKGAIVTTITLSTHTLSFNANAMT